MKLAKAFKKATCLAAAVGIYVSSAGFNINTFDLAELQHYTKELNYEPFYGCPVYEYFGWNKTYEDYRMITDPTSNQYWYIRNHMSVDYETGMLYDEDGFIGVALGNNFGAIGERYYFTLSTGIVIPGVKIDEKDIRHAVDGCERTGTKDVIEFVIYEPSAKAYFGAPNGLASQGNFNNSSYFHGWITKIEHVTGGRRTTGTDPEPQPEPVINTNYSWQYYNGLAFWYEDGVRQGTVDDPQGVWYDGTNRGREIYEPNYDAWMWLDAARDGAAAASKEVFMPYIYRGEAPGSTDGKWVRYDRHGFMIKGWYEGENGWYFYHMITGQMLKGTWELYGEWHHFNEITGIMEW
ncbi:MAG: hypothetical protein IKD69_16525 [Solobacterium sp.]|nr:hypothetical protein [Solobacterium sp.]